MLLPLCLTLNKKRVSLENEMVSQYWSRNLLFFPPLYGIVTMLVIHSIISEQTLYA